MTEIEIIRDCIVIYLIIATLIIATLIIVYYDIKQNKSKNMLLQVESNEFIQEIKGEIYMHKHMHLKDLERYIIQYIN